MFINGEWTSAAGGKMFEVFNPATGQQIGSVPDGGARDTELAIDAAANAFKSWSESTAYLRSEYLYTAYRIMLDNSDHLASVMTQEQANRSGLRKTKSNTAQIFSCGLPRRQNASMAAQSLRRGPTSALLSLNSLWGLWER